MFSPKIRLITLLCKSGSNYFIKNSIPIKVNSFLNKKDKVEKKYEQLEDLFNGLMRNEKSFVELIKENNLELAVQYLNIIIDEFDIIASKNTTTQLKIYKTAVNLLNLVNCCFPVLFSLFISFSDAN